VKNLLHLFLKLTTALLFGCLIAVGFMQNDPCLKGALEKRIISSAKAIIGEPFKITVNEIDLLHGEVIMSDLSSASSEGSWSFTCPEIRLKVSWLSWFKGGNNFDATLAFEEPVLYTTFKNRFLAIEKPFYALVNAPFTLPLNLAHCYARGSIGTIEGESAELVVHGSVGSTFESQVIKTFLLANDGYVRRDQRLLVEHLNGRLTIESPRTDDPYSCMVKCSGMHPGGMVYSLYGSYSSGIGSCHCRSEDGITSFKVRTHMTNEGIIGEVTLQAALRDLAHYVTDDPAAYEAKGLITFSGTVVDSSQGYRYEGQASLDDAYYRGIALSSAHLKLEGDQKEFKAIVSDAETSGIGLKGSLTGRFDSQDISGLLSFSRPYEGIPHCILEKGRSKIYYKDGLLKSEFKVESRLFDRSKLSVRGSGTTDFRTAKIVGTAGGNSVHAEFSWDPFLISTLTVSDLLHQKRISLHRDASDPHILKGMIDGSILKKIIATLTGYELNGSLEAQIRALRIEEGQRIEFLVKDASLKIPGTYTVIKELSGILEIDRVNRTLKVHDFKIALHKGFAWSSTATFTFNEAGELSAAHIPLQCKDLLISKQKELFGTISGGITCSYEAARWRCTGLLMIENAHLRSNLLSSQVQKDLMSSTARQEAAALDLDLRVQTRSPLKVKTSFLTTDAHIDLKIKGKASSPDFEGSIELMHGSFEFPYKPLFVSQGKLTLAPHQPEGPIINLIAKNKIRGYTLTMEVRGSLAQPEVHFEASPQLSEEGIITLLLAGSDHGSLSAAMPRLFMQQIEDVIFGSDEKLTAAQQFLKGLLTPLKNVRLVKKGSTQDDLQAVVEVDINDRLRAKAQNNLTLSDDTQLELEYIVSDDVTVKAVRDQEGSLGGEVEMRWKF
jgi:hypothetical protein